MMPIEGRLIDLNASPPRAAVGLVPTTGAYNADVNVDASSMEHNCDKPFASCASLVEAGSIKCSFTFPSR